LEAKQMLLANEYPFLDVFWTMIIFFAWVAWLWTVFTVFADVFRRDDIGGWGKAGWVVLVIVLPFLGVLIYLIAQHDGMRERSLAQAKSQKVAFDSYVREAAGGSAAEIAKAKELLDSGAISQAEFDAIKAKALS
jgi:Short C-terminal domain/Phospholipase_D-nuclease N-terminal